MKLTITSRLQNNLADLNLARAVAQSTAAVHPELRAAVQRTQHGNVEQRPRLQLQPGPRPDTAPAGFRDVLFCRACISVLFF